MDLASPSDSELVGDWGVYLSQDETDQAAFEKQLLEQDVVIGEEVPKDTGPVTVTTQELMSLVNEEFEQDEWDDDDAADTDAADQS